MYTTTRSKENAYGFVKMLLQEGRLDLPRHPALLKQLGALAFEELPAGGFRISVPSRLGHDDLAAALATAVSVLVGGDTELPGGVFAPPAPPPRRSRRLEDVEGEYDLWTQPW